MLGSACTDVRPGQVASATERSAAQDLVTQISAMTSQRQPRVPGQFFQATDTQAISTLLAITPPFMPSVRDAENLEHLDLTSCLIGSTAGTSATLTECKLAGHVLDGTWSTQGSRVHADLVDVFMSDAEPHGSVALGADLAQTIDSDTGQITGLNGSVELGMTWTADSRDHFLDVSIRVDNLVLDTPGCASGGTIIITGKHGDSALGPVTLSFGPSCQDIQVSSR